MNVCECVISCKSGDQVIYRGVKKEDAEALYQHQCTIAQETYFTSLYPEELLYNIERKVEGSRKFRTIQSIFRLLQLMMGRLLVRQKCV